MREFSKFEQGILRIFVDLYKEDRLCRANVLSELYGDTVYIINKTDDYNPLKYNKDKIEIKSILNDLVSIKFLYDYLLKSGYINESSSTKLSISLDGRDKVLEDYSEYNIIYPDSTSWVNASNQSYKIWLSQVLIDLVDHKFKTPEQHRFEKQQKVTWFGIGVAILIGLISIILSLYSISKPTSLKESKQIEQEIRSVKTETPKLINQQIKNDTLKVSMIKK